MNQEKIGKFISECRKEKHLTQEELAQKFNVSRRTISRWENGNYMPDIALLIPLSKELNVSVEELLNGVKNNHVSDEDMVEILNSYVKLKEKEKNREIIEIIILLCIQLILLIYSFLYTNSYTFLVALLILLIYLIYKTIKVKKIFNIIMFIITLMYFSYSFFTCDGATRICILLMGHPIDAYTTTITKFDEISSKNTNYYIVENKIKVTSGDMGLVKVKKHGPFKISSYYGY